MTEQPPYDPYDPNAAGGAPPPPPPGYGGQEGGYGAPPPPGGYGGPPPPPGYGGGYGQPPGYGPPGYGGGGYPPPQGTNQKAIWALVCSIVGFCCFIVAIVGIVLGYQAKEETAATGQPGNGLAQAAFIVGIVAVAINLVYIAFGR